MKYDVYRVQAVQRAIQILGLFSAEHPQVSLREIAEALGVHKSTAHRIAATLEEGRLLRRDATGTSYTLGLALLDLGRIVLAGLELRSRARAHMEALNARTGQTVHLAVMDGDEAIYIDKIEGVHGLRMESAVGKRASIHCTALGKVLLAALPDVTVRRLLTTRGMRRYTDQTIVTIPEMLTHLQEVRQNGYALDRGEHERLVHCVAAPVRNYTGKVAGAVSVATITARMPADTLREYTACVTECAARISADMGYNPSPAGALIGRGSSL